MKVSLMAQLAEARERDGANPELVRDGAKSDGLTQTNEIASKSQRDGAKPDGLTQSNEIASKNWREMELSLMA